MNELVGKSILRLEMSENNDYLLFHTNEGSFMYACYGDCCSESWINHIADVRNLFNGAVTKIETSEDFATPATRQESEYMSFFRVFTAQQGGRWEDCAVFEFRNSSNGYYSGSLDRIKYPLDPSYRIDQAFREIKEDF